MTAREILQDYYDHLTEAHNEPPVSRLAGVNSLPYANVQTHHERQYPDCEWKWTRP